MMKMGRGLREEPYMQPAMFAVWAMERDLSMVTGVFTAGALAAIRQRKLFAWAATKFAPIS